MMLSFEENQHAARFHPDQRDRRFIFGSQPVTRNRAFPETTSGKTLIGLTLQASIGVSCRRTAVRMALARSLPCLTALVCVRVNAPRASPHHRGSARKPPRTP